MSVSLLSVSGLPSFKEQIFQGIMFIGCFQMSHMQYGTRRNFNCIQYLDTSQWKRHGFMKDSLSKWYW